MTDAERLFEITNRTNLRWECTDDFPEDDPDLACGDVVSGTDGCSDYQVIAVGVSKRFGEMIVRDIVARDVMLAALRLARPLIAEAVNAPESCPPSNDPRRVALRSVDDAISIAAYPDWMMTD